MQVGRQDKVKSMHCFELYKFAIKTVSLVMGTSASINFLQYFQEGSETAHSRLLYQNYNAQQVLVYSNHFYINQEQFMRLGSHSQRLWIYIPIVFTNGVVFL